MYSYVTNSMCGVISHLFIGLSGHVFIYNLYIMESVLNQVHASPVPGFLKIAFVSQVSMQVCVLSQGY